VVYVGECVQVLVGDRYGDAFLQDSISATEFAVLTDIASDMKLHHAHLLDKLYEYDENAVPPAYSLKVCPALVNVQQDAAHEFRIQTITKQFTVTCYILHDCIDYFDCHTLFVYYPVLFTFYSVIYSMLLFGLLTEPQFRSGPGWCTALTMSQPSRKLRPTLYFAAK